MEDMKALAGRIREIAYDIQHGLLINFGSYRFEIQKFIENR